MSYLCVRAHRCRAPQAFPVIHTPTESDSEPEAKRAKVGGDASQDDEDVFGWGGDLRSPSD